MNDHGRRLQQAGMVLFLLALLVGLGLHKLAVPRLGLSAHLLGIMQGTFLVAAGVMWPNLHFTRGQSALAALLAVCGCVAAWLANLAGAAWGAGGAMLSIAGGTARGTPLQEIVIVVLLRGAAVALVLTTLLILWGLRGPAPDQV